MLRRLRLRLRALFRRHTVEAELDEELRYHVERDIDRRIARGVSRRAARAAVRREFGDVDVLKEASRDARGTRWLEDIGQDVRFAIRTLAKSRGFTVAAVLTLALGIGMTTAMFSVVHGVLLRRLPFDDPDRLVVLRTVIDGDLKFGVSPPNFMSLREETTRSFAAIAGYAGTSRVLTGIDEPRRLGGARVSGRFFEALGVRALLGRTFRPEDHEPGNHYVVLLSHSLWLQQFGGDREVIGRTIQLSGTPHIVIGVMPPSLSFFDDALWIPQPYGGRSYFSAAITEGRHRNAGLPVLARVRPGVSLEAARGELDVLGRRLEARFPEANAATRFSASALHEEIVGDARTPLLLLFGAVGFVLFIACANVTGLLLARTAVRREEVAVRAALGARRDRIIRQLVTESLVLGLGGGTLGVILAFWATNSFVALWPDALPRFETIGVNGIVLAFALALAVGVSVLAGLMPAFRGASYGLAATLHSGGRSGLGTQRGQRFRGALVVGQFALAVVLLVGAGLLLESFVRLTSVDPGFRTERILSFPVSLPDGGYDSDERIRTFFARLSEGIEQQPGVESVGMISRLPIGQPDRFGSMFRIEGWTRPGEYDIVATRIVSAGYLQTIGVPVLRGRGITVQDRADRLPIVVINEAAAEQFFPGEDPIGRRIFTFSRSYDPIENAADAFTIVGVVANVKSGGLRQAERRPEAYFAHAQVSVDAMQVVVRATSDPAALTGPIRRALNGLDPELPVPEFRTFERILADSVSRPRFFTTLISSFSAVALILAAVGIFGLLSFAVAQRTQEIGIRVALGASPRALVANVVREGLLLVITGIVIGIGGALALTRLLASQLFGVSATNPTTFAAVALVLGAVALFASLVPAWRAATVDPLVALRTE